jgi:hypothetical protein
VLGVAGVASTQAQAVYSLNAVGYVNVALVPGYNLIANPLIAATNTVETLLPAGSITGNATAFKFAAASQSYEVLQYKGGTWHSADQSLNPGEGMFLFVASAQTVTFVGEVPQGALSVPILAGYNLISTPMPVSASLTNSIYNLTLANNDVVFNFDGATQSFGVHTYKGGAFHPTDYAPAVGEAFFYNTKVPQTWSVTFSVNG